MPPPTEKNALPPEDVVREDSGPTVTEVPKRKPDDVQVDVDDGMIQGQRMTFLKRTTGTSPSTIITRLSN